MSRATRRAVTLLAIAYGSMAAVDKNSLLPDHLSKVRQIGVQTLVAIERYPITGDTILNRSWSMRAVNTWDEKLKSIKPKWDGVTVVYLARHIIEDLIVLVRDPNKLAILEYLRIQMNDLVEAIDPDGTAFKEQDEADRLLRMAYTILENG